MRKIGKTVPKSRAHEGPQDNMSKIWKKKFRHNMNYIMGISSVGALVPDSELAPSFTHACAPIRF